MKCSSFIHRVPHGASGRLVQPRRDQIFAHCTLTTMSSRAPVEIWADILQLAILPSDLFSNIDTWAKAWRVFDEYAVRGSYIDAERQRQSLRIVCRSWKMFLDSFGDLRMRAISKTRPVSVKFQTEPPNWGAVEILSLYAITKQDLPTDSTYRLTFERLRALTLYCGEGNAQEFMADILAPRLRHLHVTCRSVTTGTDLLPAICAAFPLLESLYVRKIAYPLPSFTLTLPFLTTIFLDLNYGSLAPFRPAYPSFVILASQSRMTFKPSVQTSIFSHRRFLCSQFATRPRR